MYWQNTHKCTLSMCEPLHISQNKNDTSIFSFPLYTCIFFFGGGASSTFLKLLQCIITMIEGAKQK